MSPIPRIAKSVSSHSVSRDDNNSRPGRMHDGPDFTREAAIDGLVAGVDEAGRGPWAGPLVVAAVILDARAIPEGIDDSKKLSGEKRAALYAEICKSAMHMSVITIGVREIDRLNILQATLSGMRRAVTCLKHRPHHVLVDGNRCPPRLPCAATALVEGDGISLSIAAASIVAKVSRDRLMECLDLRFPGYGFARHKGYGTDEHRAALVSLGPCALHRHSFAPIRNMLNR
jgi:ribonuclease HII